MKLKGEILFAIIFKLAYELLAVVLIKALNFQDENKLIAGKSDKKEKQWTWCELRNKNSQWSPGNGIAR